MFYLMETDDLDIMNTLAEKVILDHVTPEEVKIFKKLVDEL